MVEELDAVGNKIPSQTLELQQGGEASQWMSSQREGLTGLLERPLNMGHERWGTMSPTESPTESPTMSHIKSHTITKSHTQPVHTERTNPMKHLKQLSSFKSIDSLKK